MTDPGGPKTYGSGSTTLTKMFINLRGTFFQVPFNHPLFIMYSSGTTGAPKCMVHSVGGTLLKHLEEHVVQGNRDNTDVLLYYTTTGRPLL
jgi:acyl-coenzyme A synthetase/AMP-(fatty) acid ligase